MGFSSLGISILILFGGAGLGRVFHRVWRRSGEGIPERLVIDTALGLGVLSLLVLALGWLQLYGLGRGFWLALMCILAIPGLAFVVPDLYRLGRQVNAHSVSPGTAAAVSVLVVLAVAAMVPAMAPSAMSDWDSLAYHLSVPKLYLQHGGIYYIDFISHSNFPMLMEMLYVPAIALDAPASGKMMHYWMGALLVAAGAMLCRRHLDPRAAPLAAVAIAGMPIVLWEATTAYVDLATALYAVLGAYLLLNAVDTPDRRYIVGAGMAAGFAASTKMTGLAVIPLVAVWLTIDSLRADKRSLGIRGALGVVAVGAAACGAWYLRSWVSTGSPVYPFFYSVFGGRDWSPELAAKYAELQARFGMGKGLHDLVMLPYNLLFNSQAFYDTPGLLVGPLMLLALPLLVFARYDRKLGGLVAYAAAQVGIWFALTHQSRYLLPALSVLAVAMAAATLQPRRTRWVPVTVWAAVLFTAASGIWSLAPAIRAAAPVVLGVETPEAYLTRALDSYPATQWINAELPRRAKVALYGDTRGFYLDRSYVWADSWHNLRFTREYSSVEEYTEYLRQNGITHALVNYRFLGVPDSETSGSALLLASIMQGRLRQVYPEHGDRAGVAVYELE